MVAVTGRSAAGCWGERWTAKGRQGWEGGRAGGDASGILDLLTREGTMLSLVLMYLHTAGDRDNNSMCVCTCVYACACVCAVISIG